MIFLKIFIYLAASGLSCGILDLSYGMCDLIPWPRDWTQASCIGSSESYPLDRQGNPLMNDWLNTDWREKSQMENIYDKLKAVFKV